MIRIATHNEIAFVQMRRPSHPFGPHSGRYTWLLECAILFWAVHKLRRIEIRSMCKLIRFSGSLKCTLCWQLRCCPFHCIMLFDCILIQYNWHWSFFIDDVRIYISTLACSTWPYENYLQANTIAIIIIAFSAIECKWIAEINYDNRVLSVSQMLSLAECVRCSLHSLSWSSKTIFDIRSLLCCMDSSCRLACGALSMNKSAWNELDGEKK